MRFLTLPAKNLARRPIRSGLTASGIAIAVAAMLALTGLSKGLETAWTRGLVERGTHVLVTGEGSVEILTAAIDQNLVNELAAWPEISQAAGELLNLISIGPVPVLVAGWRPDSFLWQDLKMEEGGLPGPGRNDQVVIGRGLAKKMGFKTKGEIWVLGRKFSISGISKPSGTMMGATLTLPLAVLQELMNRAGQVTVINLRLKNPADAAEVKKNLAGLKKDFPKLSFMQTDEVTDNNRVLSMLRVTALAISAVALVMGVFAVLNTLLMSVFERTWEIGVLSAVGWGAGRIVALVVLEGVLISAVGGAVGLILGLAGVHWLAGLEAISGFVEVDIGPLFLAQVFGAALILGGLGGLYPALWAARLRAVEALRHS